MLEKIHTKSTRENSNAHLCHFIYPKKYLSHTHTHTHTVPQLIQSKENRFDHWLIQQSNIPDWSNGVQRISIDSLLLSFLSLSFWFDRDLDNTHDSSDAIWKARWQAIVSCLFLRLFWSWKMVEKDEAFIRHNLSASIQIVSDTFFHIQTLKK